MLALQSEIIEREKQDRLIRGLDKQRWADFRMCVRDKFGKTRGKYSYVTHELNLLLSIYIRTLGKITDDCRGDPGTTKLKIMREIEEVVGDQVTADRDYVGLVLDRYMIIDDRSRKNYIQYARRIAADNLMKEDVRRAREGGFLDYLDDDIYGRYKQSEVI